MSDTAILVRTHYVDDQVRGFIASLSEASPYPVHALVDESRAPVDFGDIAKISIGPDLPQAFGLYALTPNLYWRCGDYGLYAARRALPAMRRFWLIEPDVRLHLAQPSRFFTRFEDDPADLLAARLRPAEADWDWRLTLDDGGPVWGCLFPLVRISAAALDPLLAARQAASAAFGAANGDPRLWPNDEVFTATTLMRAGLTCRDLNADGQVYDPDRFGFWWPLSDRQLATEGREGFAYHPVLNGDAYFRKLFQLACRLKTFSALDEAITALTGLEWSAEEAVAHRRSVDLARSHFGL